MSINTNSVATQQYKTGPRGNYWSALAKVESVSTKILQNLPSLKSKAQLNKIVTTGNGSPDHLAINIYYDTILAWYKGNKKLRARGFYSKYHKLFDLHGVSHETIRRKLVKLESIGLISRRYNTNSRNSLVIHMWTNTPYFYNANGITKEEIKVLSLQPDQGGKV